MILFAKSRESFSKVLRDIDDKILFEPYYFINLR